MLPYLRSSLLPKHHRPSTSLLLLRTPFSSGPPPVVGVFWDLDNKPPNSIPPYDAAVRLRLAASSFGPLRFITAYANSHAFRHMPSPLRSHLHCRRNSSALSPPPTPYLCRVCGRNFFNHSKFLHHFAQIHQREQAKRLNRINSARGAQKVRLAAKLSMKIDKFKKAASEIFLPEQRFGLADELKRAGVFVRKVDDRPESADRALKEHMVDAMDKRKIGCLVLVSDDSGFVEVLEEARMRCLMTVVIGDEKDGALRRYADAVFSWRDVVSGKTRKHAAPAVGKWKDRGLLKGLEWRYEEGEEDGEESGWDGFVGQSEDDGDDGSGESLNLEKERCDKPWWKLDIDEGGALVRLFLSEDAPSQSGLGTQENLQAKAAWLLHAGGLDSEDSLPPGFEERHKYQHHKIEISQIPLIKWQCPPRLVLNPDWRVVAGEESEEVAIESQREPGVLEAVYPRPSSVPPNPFVTPDVQAARFDDSFTPSIPITAIEDEDGTEQACTSMPQNHVPVQLPNLPNAGPLQNSIPDFRVISEQLQSQSNAVSLMPNMPRPEQLPSASVMSTTSAALLAEPDVLAAASAAFTAIMRSSEEGSMIDRELLIKILNDPVMVQRLLSEFGAPKQTTAPQLQSAATVQTAGPSWPLPQPVVTTITAPPSQPQVQPVVTATAAPPSRPPVQPVMTTNAAAPSRPSPQPVITTTTAAPSRPPPSHIAPSGPLSAPPTSHVFHTPNHVLPPALNPHHPHIPAIPPVRPPPAPAVKDVYYYKSLIQLHGGEKQEGPDQNPAQFGNLGNPVGYYNNMPGVSNGMDPVGPGLGGMSNAADPVGLTGANQRDPKAKVQKPCAYFNTPRGCRHGASCLFQHDASSIPQRIEQQKGTTKRIKLDGVFGRN